MVRERITERGAYVLTPLLVDVALHPLGQQARDLGFLRGFISSASLFDEESWLWRFLINPIATASRHFPFLLLAAMANCALINELEHKHDDEDSWIQGLTHCKYPPEKAILELCSRAKELLAGENNVVRVDAPVTICGDIAPF